MAKAKTPDQIIAALKKWHVVYVEYPGWRTRGRPGGLTDVVGMIEHHTGGGSASASYLAFLFKEGRPAEGIPGPLCNVATAANGTVYLGAAGRANHAGSGSVITMTHVEDEDYKGYESELKPGPDGLNGNPRYYGNEWIYSGTTPPDPRQYRGAVLWTVAMCDAHGWSALSAIGHREHSRRKNDPYGVKMYEFRKEVARVLKAGPAATVNYVASGKLAAVQGSTEMASAEYTALAGQIASLRSDVAALSTKVSAGDKWQRIYELQIGDELAVAQEAFDAVLEGGGTQAEAKAAWANAVQPLIDALKQG